jgi:EAL domain-containing protein (putative c-di-GMP-specific phosphodiesterase class I)/GGDEF domain-containing protein
MDQLVWWTVFLHLGVTGSMATIGSLDIQWWSQDRTERVLGFTGALCWTVAITLLIGAFGLAIQDPDVWHVIVPVRAVLIGLTVALLLQTLSELVPLPGIRIAVIASLALPLAFVVVSLAGGNTYGFEADSPWPHFRVIGQVLIGSSFLIFVAYSVMAIVQLRGVRRWQLTATILTVVAVVATVPARGPGLLSEALTTMWTVPIAILLAWWCSTHVLELQGSLATAVVGQRQAENAARYQARHDGRTGLPNETSALESLQERIDAAGTTHRVVVCRLQINGLDDMRALHNSDSADQLFKNIAQYLMTVLPAGRDLARSAESSFLIADTIRRGLPVRQLELKLVDGISTMRSCGVLPLDLSVVMGVAVAQESTDATQLLQQAAIAVSAAEQSGAKILTYRPELRDTIVRQARTLRLLRSAVARDEFELHYQPVVRPLDLSAVSVEALVRWRHSGRLHPPAEWIPIAEHHDLMPAIGLKVLQIAVRDYPSLGCAIAVNVSPRQLSDPDFATIVLNSLQSCPPAAIILEVTESSVIADPERANQTLETLRSKGIRIALDDFGTKYSSLSRLSSVPFDTIKIDRSFVSRVMTAEGRAMVTAIEGMARALGKTTIAEGVETDEQLMALREIGCDLVQGFLTGRPVPLATIIKGRTATSQPVGHAPTDSIGSDRSR